MERINNKIDKILELMSKGSEEIESLRRLRSDLLNPRFGSQKISAFVIKMP